MRARVLALVAVAILGVLPASAHAFFDHLEIEKVIGGVNGDTTAQAVQLKMRARENNSLHLNVRLVVYNSSGSNPVVLTTFPFPNPLSGDCRPILIASAGFENVTNPPVDAAARDYEMTALIPQSYLAAGSLTFEDNLGTEVYWRLSWGGGSYTGPGTVRHFTNDDDTNVNPPFAGALPSTSLEALEYTPPCPTLSSTNLADYALTGGPAVFTNNDNSSFTVPAPTPVPALLRWGAGALVALVIAGTLVLVTRLRTRSG